MNCTNANQINIAGFLQSRGIRPNKVAGNSFWYCSPLRNEKTPSFKVDRIKNLWYDFGTSTGGGLLDLVCKIYNVDLPGALLILSGAQIEKTVLPPHEGMSEKHLQETKLEIISMQPLHNPALIQYLGQRKINHHIASLYCREAHYRTHATGKEFFALAFENNRHGYELRSKYFKGSTSPKDITTLRSKDPSGVHVFEGFMDFLSALTYADAPCTTYDTIILNGVGFTDRFMRLMPRYSNIYLFLDNDTAGKEACRRIQDLRPDAENISQRIFPQYKDFNEFLLNQTSQTPLQ
jgi:DNA primase